jgi:hypothetical protein
VATEYVTHRDLDALRAELGGEFALLRGEMMQLRGEVRGEIGKMRGEVNSLGSRIDALPTTRTIVVSSVGSAIGVAMLVLASVQLA